MEQKNLVNSLAHRIFLNNLNNSNIKAIIILFSLSFLGFGIAFFISLLLKGEWLKSESLQVLGFFSPWIIYVIVEEKFLYKKERKESLEKALNHKFKIGNKVGYKNGFHFKENCPEFVIKDYDDSAEIFLLSRGNDLKEVKLDYFLDNFISLEK